MKTNLDDLEHFDADLKRCIDGDYVCIIQSKAGPLDGYRRVGCNTLRDLIAELRKLRAVRDAADEFLHSFFDDDINAESSIESLQLALARAKEAG